MCDEDHISVRERSLLDHRHTGGKLTRPQIWLVVTACSCSLPHKLSTLLRGLDCSHVVSNQLLRSRSVALQKLLRRWAAAAELCAYRPQHEQRS